MITAFVLLGCEPGFEKQIKNEISGIPEVIDLKSFFKNDSEFEK